MNVRRGGFVPPAGYPQNAAASREKSTSLSVGSTVSGDVDERRAFDHEHGRLYDALEKTAQLAELAGHDRLAKDLRWHRRGVAAEIQSGRCEQ